MRNITYISTGAGFLPSTVWIVMHFSCFWPQQIPSSNCAHRNPQSEEVIIMISSQLVQRSYMSNDQYPAHLLCIIIGYEFLPSLAQGLTNQDFMEHHNLSFLWLAHISIYILHVCIINTYLHTYLPTYIHTYLPTYLHTYIHTYITLHYITLHYITLHYSTFHYITLHYITLHYITLHYITLHYIHTYIRKYIYVNIHIFTYIATHVLATLEEITCFVAGFGCTLGGLEGPSAVDCSKRSSLVEASNLRVTVSWMWKKQRDHIRDVCSNSFVFLRRSLILKIRRIITI